MSDIRLSDLFQNGAVVALHVSMWRAHARIVAADLGLPDTSEAKRALSLGVHRLADAAAFAEVSGEAREAARAIDRVSLAFPLIPAARYVPIDRLETLVRRLAEIRDGFNVAADKLAGEYESIRARQLLVIRGALVDALKGDEVAADRAVLRISGEYPSAVRGKFSLSFDVYTLQSASNATVQAIADEGGQVRSILSGMVEGLRSDVTEKLGQILETVAKGGRLSTRSIGAALVVLDRVDEMNILGDVVLAEQSRRLRRLLSSVQTVGELSVIDGLQDVQAALGRDTAEAVAAAEAALTGLGRRKLSLVS